MRPYSRDVGGVHAAARENPGARVLGHKIPAGGGALCVVGHHLPEEENANNFSRAAPMNAFSSCPHECNVAGMLLLGAVHKNDEGGEPCHK